MAEATEVHQKWQIGRACWGSHCVAGKVCGKVLEPISFGLVKAKHAWVNFVRVKENLYLSMWM